MKKVKRIMVTMSIAAGIAAAALSIAKAHEEEPAARTTWDWEVSEENDMEDREILILEDEEITLWDGETLPWAE